MTVSTSDCMALNVAVTKYERDNCYNTACVIRYEVHINKIMNHFTFHQTPLSK